MRHPAPGRDHFTLRAPHMQGNAVEMPSLMDRRRYPTSGEALYGYAISQRLTAINFFKSERNSTAVAWIASSAVLAMTGPSRGPARYASSGAAPGSLRPSRAVASHPGRNDLHRDRGGFGRAVDKMRQRHTR
jgi:hypothetical protein